MLNVDAPRAPGPSRRSLRSLRRQHWGPIAIAIVALALPTAFVCYDVALPAGPYDPEHSWSAAIALLHHATKPAFVVVLFFACVLAAERLDPGRVKAA